MVTSFHSEEFIVGVENINYYPHYDFTNKKQSGYIYDLLELFSKTNNHKFTFVALPIKRLRKQLLETNEIDFMYPDNPIWEQFHIKLDNKVYSDAIVFALGGTLVKTENLGKGSYYVKSLSVPHGFTPTEWLKIKKQRSIKIMAVKNAEAALALVIKGRVDAADVEFNVAQQLLEKLGSQNAVKLDPDLPFINVAF